MIRAVAVVVVLSLFIVLAGVVAYGRLFNEVPEAVAVVAPLAASNGGDTAAVDPTTTTAAPAAAAVPNAVLSAARGTVQVRKGNDEKAPWTDVAAGTVLSSDDSVRAGRNAEATITMGDGVEVRLSPRSELRVRELSEAVARVRLDEGHVTATVADGKNRVLRVQTKGGDAEAESRGGTFGVVTDGRGQLAVATSTGTVKLTAKGESVDVAAGQASTVTAGAAPTAPTALASSLFLKIGALAATQTNQTSTTVSGTTAPGALVRVGEQTTTSDARGRFAMRVPLRDGKNDLAVEVQDASGRREDKRLPPVMVDRVKPKIDAAVKWGGDPDPNQKQN
ncbi:MAG: FecR domain-containing protein [Deltaproteobacteria bacterium]|nr:FecR domain-containing protein [Deltaproteobacteria bacterium]